MSKNTGPNVVATRVDDIDKHLDTLGAFSYYKHQGSDEIMGMIFICPCGCGGAGTLSFDVNSPRPRWSWDGNREAPTIRPSVRQLVCGWHGWLTAGVWTSC